MAQKRAARFTIAIDTGGTFTDCVYRVNGRIEVVKLPSTPEDPGRAIVEGVARIVERVGVREIEVRHGTTVATNALLERKGARVAFVTTEGFEDTLAIGRQARPSLYDWNVHRPAPLAEFCFGVAERVGADGEVLRAPSTRELAELRQRVIESGAESVAVSLLFSFVHPKHEEAVAAALRGLGLPLSLSHQILPEFREFERGATVTLNAYLAPKMQGYLGGLEKKLSARGAQLKIMQSSGGILSAEAAAREPVRTILSGPAGGVIGALSVARAAGVERVLSFDMGGTSTDVALLDASREPGTSVEGEVAGMPVRVPMLDIHTAGAGGGSLAWIDAAGALQVGPQSAGADPGPACYGRGEGATVTDANLVLRRLHAEHFLAGALRLDWARARRAVERVRAAAKGFASVEDAAEGIVRVANVRMESALRRVSVERGYDPRDFSLLAFGGAGPLHACALATALGMWKALVPSAPGALSALGILDADLRREFSRTVMLAPGSSRIASVFRDLEAEARAVFRAEGLHPVLTRSADLRYHGQGFELRVDWGGDVVSRFNQLHAQRYGYADRARRVEIVTLRVQAVVRTARPRAAGPKRVRVVFGNARIGTHRVFEDGKWRQAALYDRALLRPGDRVAGPAVIVELSATTYVARRWNAAMDGLGNLVLTRAAKTPARTERRR
ncbi:MAG TPA: hydantoinase/oxoprolinase family protein [Terracidiphilus sp.]|jgi:N-methylhydantoinase A|nr:hydantoinase/oxoprolinase family protein [Terracidiphilus sp.]